MSAKQPLGMTLIELMIAVAIGGFLMIGALTIFMQSRATFRVTESLARLQENARFALDALEAEVRMASYWGLTNSTTNVINRAGSAAPNGPGPDTCGNNWAIDLDAAVGGSNNGYAFGCAPFGAAAAGSDTLVVRRASVDAEVPPLPGRNTLRIQSARGIAASQIFTGTAVPAGFDARTSATHRLLVNGFYVDTTSSLPGMPSLRVKTLLTDGTVQDQEVVPGVEDVQVQFGVDTDAPGAPDRGSIDRYVDPGDALLDATRVGFDPAAVIVAVRLWVRVRAEHVELGFTDAASYAYAGQVAGPFNDGFRRLVFAKTVALRNARPPA